MKRLRRAYFIGEGVYRKVIRLRFYGSPEVCCVTVCVGGCPYHADPHAAYGGHLELPLVLPVGEGRAPDGVGEVGKIARLADRQPVVRHVCGRLVERTRRLREGYERGTFRKRIELSRGDEKSEIANLVSSPGAGLEVWGKDLRKLRSLREFEHVGEARLQVRGGSLGKELHYPGVELNKGLTSVPLRGGFRTSSLVDLSTWSRQCCSSAEVPGRPVAASSAGSACSQLYVCESSCSASVSSSGISSSSFDSNPPERWGRIKFSSGEFA
eukprot:1195828-Prorocentrum_minimum.AAC.10